MSEPSASHTGDGTALSPVRSARKHKKAPALIDFTSISPYSPESVYTNLIIVEHSLRSQFVELQRSRRWGLLFFWSTVAGAAFMTYRARYVPSEYRSVRLLCQFLTVAFYISIGLFFLTGMYSKTFKVAPKFLPDTNKGMRSLNIRLVRTGTSLSEKVARLVNPVYSKSLVGPVKLDLSTREFSPSFIEEWELFRDEYWKKQAKRSKLISSKRKT